MTLLGGVNRGVIASLFCVVETPDTNRFTVAIVSKPTLINSKN